MQASRTEGTSSSGDRLGGPVDPFFAPAGRAAVIASLVEPLETSSGALENLRPEVGWIEVRADQVGELDPEALRERTGRRLLYTYRSTAEGGAGAVDPVVRQRRFLDAVAKGYDLVDLEGRRDLRPEILSGVPPERRVVSWHGGPKRPGDLKGIAAELSQVPSRLVKLVPAANEPIDAAAPLLALRSLGRPDLTAFCSGAAGLWSRPLAPRLGAPVAYGSLGSAPAAPGQPTVDALCDDYGLPELPTVDRLYGIVGNPVTGSLSPRLHNGAYRDLGLPALYLPFQTAHFSDLWLDLVDGEALPELGLPLAGLSVTAPFKDLAVAVAGAVSPRAQTIGSANTLALTRGVWEATTTDPEGVVDPLRWRGHDLASLAAVVVGAGGAGRAAAFGLRDAGAAVTLANRSVERGVRAAQDLDIAFVALGELELGDFDLVVHATSQGRVGEPSPLRVETMADDAAVVDLVYGPSETTLVAEARAMGLTVVDGKEVLLAQALHQFETLTGRPMPVAEARRRLGLDPAPEAADSKETVR